MYTDLAYISIPPAYTGRGKFFLNGVEHRTLMCDFVRYEKSLLKMSRHICDTPLENLVNGIRVNDIAVGAIDSR